MAEYKDREHYIPVRRSDLVNLLCGDRGMSETAAAQFRQMCDLLAATFHFEYHRLLEELKNDYSPFDPDEVTKAIVKPSPEERTKKLAHLFERFHWLMERANFKHVSRDEIIAATKIVSDWGLNMDVDFSLFDRFDLYARGDSIGSRSRRRIINMWRFESIDLPIYQRLVLIVKLKPSKRLPDAVDTDDVFLKVFKEIPKMDIEMLLPGARFRMPGTSRLKLSGSFISGLALIIYNIFRQLVGAAVFGFWGVLLAVCGYGYRQYHGYQSTKNLHSLRLTQSLYYQNLGNNLGVVFHLLDEAEEQEGREAMLAYYYLWRYAGEQGWLMPDLDDYVEMDLERLAGVKVDFEVDDAMAKLERLNLVTRNGDRYVAVPIETALERLDYAWDNYFKYNKEAAV